MMNRRVKIVGACVLTLAVTLSGLALPRAYAAKAVDVNRKCTIEFNLQNNVYDAATENKEGEKAEDFKELNTLPGGVQVHLYQVAEIKETGAYEEVEGFDDLKLDEISDKTTAEEWADKAAKARELIEKETEPGAETSVTLTNGTGKITGLATGMYLVVADEVKSSYFTYTFKESLISLPNNYWYNGGGNDDWVYELTGSNAIGLKPDREERLGSLEINKTLTSYNATVGGATFVFHVNVEKLDGTVTNNVYKMEFNGAGNDKLIINDLPAGATVTVTEEYTGASYRLSPDNGPQETKIIAEEEEGNPVSVSFVNKYDGGQNGGSGIMNRFYMKDGSVDCENDLKPEVN